MPITGTGDGVGEGSGVGMVVGTDVGVSVVVGVGNGVTGEVVTGADWRRENVADPVTSIVTPVTVTLYSSGFHADVSTSNDQRFWPLVPGTTFTTPAAPENSPDWVFCVGWNEDE